MEMVMEKSWILKSWPKVIEFFATTKKLSIYVESLHFPQFSAKCHECKMEKRDCHGKLRNGHGKVMKKYFVKAVGTLNFIGMQYLAIVNCYVPG